MVIVINCKCGQRIKAQERDRGRHGRCPKCGGSIVVEGETLTPGGDITSQSPIQPTANTGQSNTGQSNTGQSNTGQPNTGQPISSSSPPVIQPPSQGSSQGSSQGLSQGLSQAGGQAHLSPYNSSGYSRSSGYSSGGSSPPVPDQGPSSGSVPVRTQEDLPPLPLTPRSELQSNHRKKEAAPVPKQSPPASASRPQSQSQPRPQAKPVSSSPIASSPHSSGSRRLPDKIAHYALVERIGSGAMADVWRAKDTRLGRDVAIKILAPELADDEQRLTRFIREAKLTACLTHPNVVNLYQISRFQGIVYIVMELVAGGTLEQWVHKHGPMDWQRATVAIRDAAAGLQEAHDRGFVHRDVKPANLLYTTKQVTKIADFGVALAQFHDTRLTQTGAAIGTPYYMAPEQWRGKDADNRSDLYSLICTYYYLLTGSPPYDAPTPIALGYQHQTSPFPDPRQERRDLPNGLWEILEKGGQKNPDDRFQSANELMANLNRMLTGVADGEGLDDLDEEPEVSPTAGLLFTSTLIGIGTLWALWQGCAPS